MKPGKLSYALTLVILFFSGAALAAEVDVSNAAVVADIDGENLTFTVRLDIVTQSPGRWVDVAVGEVVLDEVRSPGAGYTVAYDADRKAYRMDFGSAGPRTVEFTLAAKPTPVGDTRWREASFEMPASRVRELKLTCDRSDLEVELVGAVRVKRHVEDGKLTITGVQGADRRFVVRWKPRVQDLDAELVFAAELNTIASVQAGAVRLDTLIVYDVAQGKMDEITLRTPKGLSVTQVLGNDIRDWRIETTGGDGPDLLHVALSRPQTGRYGLQVVGESTVAAFPVQMRLPVVDMVGGIRAGGHLAVGTDSAITLVVKEAGGVSQIDARAMPNYILDNEHPRRVPAGKVFYYAFAADTYGLVLDLDHVEPTTDAAVRVLARVGQDDLRIDTQVELDVRDAPLRHVDLTLPAGMTLVSVTGALVDDYRLTADDPTVTDRVRVTFTQPVLGHVVVDLRLELGRSPLDDALSMAGFGVDGARGQRGFVVLASDQGVELGEIDADAGQLREVNIASLPVRVDAARYAFRFGEPGWSLGFKPTRTPPGVRVEAFHLITLGDGVTIGNVTFSYFITGSPIDELSFRVDPGLRNIEFVGRDVRYARQDEHDPGLWIVKLQRRVLGDYNLAVTYSQPGGGDSPILAGGVRCASVASQAGYLVVASHRDVDLTAGKPTDVGLIEIDREELPANYRLLVAAPMIACYRYSGEVEPMPITVDAYETGSLLPAVIEMTEVATRIAAQDDGDAESATTVTFKVKNSSSQFMSLRLPPGAEVWSTRLAEGYQTDAGGNVLIDEQGVALVDFKRIIASHNESTGELLIPLQRPRDPNTPVTIELVYGQVHPSPGFSGKLSLQTPVGSVASTYESWRVSVPVDWAVHAEAGDLQPEPREEHHGRLSRVLRSVGSGWAWAVPEALGSVLTWWVFGAAAFILGIMMVSARGAVLDTAVGLCLVLVLLLGIVAANAPVFVSHVTQQDDLTMLEFTRVMSVTSGEPASVSLRVTPAWRQYADVFSAVVVPLIGLLAVVLGMIQRQARRVLVAVGLALLLYGACRFPVLSAPVGYLLTWGVPALLVCVFIGTVVVPRIRRATAIRSAAVTATMLALWLFMLPGCVSADKPPVDADGAVLDRIELDLSVEDDAMACEMRLDINAAEPMRINLLESGAILLSAEHSTDSLALEPADGRYEFVVKRAGKYAATVRFLLPLPRGDDPRAGSFQVPIPPSLTNRITLTIPGTAYEVACPSAVRLTKQEADGNTTLHAIVAHHTPVRFNWRPRARQRSLEDTVFYAGTVALARFGAGIIAQTTDVRLDIAQGQLDTLTLEAPGGVSVTSVIGPDIGAWRFDPATRLIEAKLTRPATGAYTFRVVMQRALADLPAQAELARVEVIGARHQRSVIGLVQTPNVYTVVDEHPSPVNVDDFTREAQALLTPEAAQSVGGIRSAYRVEPGDIIIVTTHRVLSELRTTENASFTLSDERLVYNSTFALEITKSGRFSIDLAIPRGYDIDALSAPEVSHWDEAETNDGRAVTVHFRAKTVGTVNLSLTLSRSIGELPGSLEAPRVEAIGSLKHVGQLVVSSEQGVRVSVAERSGISEFDPAELGIRVPGALAFRLLRPGWSLMLNTEVIDPVIDARMLHTAHVSESIVRHQCYIRHNIRHAGAKLFRVRLPASATGVVITGSEIVRISQPEPADPGLYQVELARKQLSRPYQLNVRYETAVGDDSANIAIQPVVLPDAERQRGYVLIKAGPRVELTQLSQSQAMQPAEARTIPREFGAGDLSDAALCYVTSGADYRMDLSITRHDAAALLDASVRRVDIESVITETGQSINRVQLELTVGGKRHLQLRLPTDARVWSLLVGARSAVPSVREDGGEPVYLIPLSPDAAGDLPVRIDLVYVTSHDSVTRRTGLDGPRFDLPLHNVNWTLYAPPGYTYSDFSGTLTYSEPRGDEDRDVQFTAGTYQQQVQRMNLTNLAKALDYQEQGNELAATGQQRAARQALESAWFYSLSDPALNEDARVQLHRLTQEQALVGLVGNRGRLRQQSGVQQQPDPAETLGENFDRDQAKQLRNTLNKADSENLEAIIGRMIESQDEAAAAGVPLMVTLPVRGKALHFSRAIQVSPNAPMHVSFDADTPMVRRLDSDPVWAVAIFAGLLLVLTAVSAVGRGLRASGFSPSPATIE